MPPSILEMTKDLVLAQIQTGVLAPEDMQEALGHTHQSLMTLKSREESGSSAADMPQAPMDWRKSITQHSITCLECGAQLRQLNGRHLRQHNLDARTYRDKYGIPHSQPLAARATTANRRQIVAAVKPWEKSPTYRKGQERAGNTAPKPETEAPTHQRKAARKKSSEG
jgi:predicted transcriptional regulator